MRQSTRQRNRVSVKLRSSAARVTARYGRDEILSLEFSMKYEVHRTKQLSKLLRRETASEEIEFLAYIPPLFHQNGVVSLEFRRRWYASVFRRRRRRRRRCSNRAMNNAAPYVVLIIMFYIVGPCFVSSMAAAPFPSALALHLHIHYLTLSMTSTPQGRRRRGL